MIEVVLGKHSAVILPNLGWKINGDARELFEVPKTTSRSVEDFVVPSVLR